MEFNYFDIITGAIILLLGLKGIVNGFFKEIFALIGIIGVFLLHHGSVMKSVII